MKATLEQQIQELTKKHEFNKFAESISHGVKYVACLSKRNFISFDCKTINEAQTLLNSLKPTNKTNKIGTATDNFYKTIDSPYRLDIDNPAMPDQYRNFILKISFELNDIDIWINIPLYLIGYEYFNSGLRKVTDCELHYFGGISRDKIGDLRCYTFKNNYVVSFYGGSKSLFCGIETENLINIILNKQ